MQTCSIRDNRRRDAIPDQIRPNPARTYVRPTIIEEKSP